MKKTRLDIVWKKLKGNHGESREWKDGHREIAINATDPVELQIETLAHEFAHQLVWLYAPLDIDKVRQEKFADRAGKAFSRLFRKMRRGE